MKPKTLLILAVVVAVLAAFIWFVERDLPSSEERAELRDKVFSGLEEDDVEAVTLAWEGQTVRLEKATAAESETAGEEADVTAGEDEEDAETEAAEWRLAEPLAARADRREVEDLLRDLLELKKERTVEEAEPAELGLEPPRVTVTLVTAEGEQALSFGSELPLSGGVVAALAGRPEVYVVPSNVVEGLTREPGSWRDRVVLPFTRDEIARVRLTGPGGGEPVALGRNGEAFRLEAPVADRADEDEVRDLLFGLAELKCQEFLDGPEAAPEAVGLTEPWAVIEVEPKTGEPLVLEVGSAVDADLGRYHGRVGDQVFVFQVGDLADLVGRSAGDWRSPSLSALEVFRIDALTVADDEGEMRVERREGNWWRGEAEIPYTPVSDLLYAIVDSEAEKLLSGEEAAGLAQDDPVLRFTLETGGGETSAGEDVVRETLAVYPLAAGGAPATAGDREGVVLLLPADRLAKLREAVAEVRAAEPVPADGEEDLLPDLEGEPGGEEEGS